MVEMQIRLIKKHKGLGDTVESLAKLTGMNHVADAIAKGVGAEDCGCGARKDTLNNPDLLINKMFYGSDRKDS